MPLRVLRSPAAPSGHAWISEFLRHLDEQYALLAYPRPPHVELLDDARHHPELLLYFGTDPWDDLADPTFSGALASYAEQAPHLLPIIENANSATTHLAPSLLRFNAFLREKFPGTFAQALVDEVLTLIWQRRRRRRIFISYRRTESLAVAHQLQARYSARSFDVFLDERSIEPAVDFQLELLRELNDMDAVLLLLSPGVTKSPWVRQEIQFAVTRRIGLLGVIWPPSPDDEPSRSAEAAEIPLDLRLDLRRQPHSKRGLSPAELRKVDHMLFTGRSRVIASRTRDLLDNAERHLRPTFKVTSRREDGDLELTRGGVRWLGRVTPFRPMQLDLWRWREELSRAAAPPHGLVVLYPQVDASDPGERAFREIFDPWGAAAEPQIELRSLPL